MSRDDWADAALRAISAGGLSAVVVETLARELGVTKGSFYWHFKNRRELIEAALEMWEWRGTLSRFEELDRLPTPEARLLHILMHAYRGHWNPEVDVALLADAADPLVRSFLERVSAERLSYMAGMFREMGFRPRESRHRALIVYTAFFGYVQLHRATPDEVPSDGGEERYLRHVLEVVTAR